MSTALVILDDLQTADLLVQIGQVVQITQQLPTRLFLVEGDQQQLAVVRNLPGVVGVFTQNVPESILQQLTATERLFAEAWIAGSHPKTFRSGDGLPWDAPDFQPPDPQNT